MTRLLPLIVSFGTIMTACSEGNITEKQKEPVPEASIIKDVKIEKSNVKIPETTSEYTSVFSPDISYTNQTSQTIPVYAGPESEAKIIDQLQPGYGNFLVECTVDFTRCSMNYKGTKELGWVEMDSLSGIAD